MTEAPTASSPPFAPSPLAGLGAWQFRWGFPMRLSQRIQFGLDECRRALAGAGRWLPPLVLATDGRLKNSIIPH